MSERFSRLSSLAPNQYAEGSPVLLCAGALLKDQVTGQILAQLKFMNLSSKRIKALKVTLFLQDAAGRSIDVQTTYRYLDLMVPKDAEFGQKQAIPLSESSARSYSVTVDEVVFEDNTIYTGSGEVFSPLPEFKPLSDALNSPELVKQFTLACGGGTCRYVPECVRDLWYCTCGRINTSGEALCPNCHRSFARLSEAMDLDSLTEAMNQRLEKEAEARAKEQARLAAAKQAAMLKAQKRAKRAKRAAIIVVALAAAGAAAFFVTTKAIIPAVKYNNAAALMDAGQYNEAIAAFEAMAGYKDSAEQISECKYRSALNLMDEGKLSDAISAFQALGNYKDSAEQIVECNYRSAIQLAKNQNYSAASELLERIGGYKDSTELALEYRYLHAKQLMNSGSYDDAANLLKKLAQVNYKDYLKMEERETGRFWCSYNLPWQYDGDFYTIENGIYYEGYNNSSRKDKEFRFTIVSWSKIEVYCFKNGRTYTLKRQ